MLEHLEGRCCEELGGSALLERPQLQRLRGVQSLTNGRLRLILPNVAELRPACHDDQDFTGPPIAAWNEPVCRLPSKANGEPLIRRSRVRIPEGPPLSLILKSRKPHTTESAILAS